MSAPGGFDLWPDAISSYAGSVDALAISFFLLILALSAPVGVTLVWFTLRYRRTNETVNRDQPRHGRGWLEWSWMIIPFLLSLAFFVWAGKLYIDFHRPPENAREIYAVGLQWMWKFEHPGGQREINTLHVPAGEPVRVILRSKDVIHSLYVPTLRIKQDAVPGQTTSLWFIADTPGRYRLTCAEFCGLDHARMKGELVVMTPEDYQNWLSRNDAGQPMAMRGAALFRSFGCSGCHVGEGPVRAPDLHGLYGRAVPLASGGTVMADDRYITDSILLPESEVAAGYDPVMPSFADVADESEIAALTAYIKSLADDSKQPGGTDAAD